MIKNKSINKKVRNATKIEYKGIVFDSKLELCFYKLCESNKIEVQLKNKYVIMPKFRYNNENYREIVMFPDFYLPKYDFIIETKGYENDVFPIKKKLLMYHLHNTNSSSQYFILKNQKECLVFINQLKD
jgi:hypothetical protein